MTARTVLHGVDQSAPSHAPAPGRATWAPTYVEDLRGRRVYDEKARAWLPEEYVPFCWDFAVHGGKVGTIDLGVPIQAGTIILDGLVDVVEAITSDEAATIALHVRRGGRHPAAATSTPTGAPVSRHRLTGPRPKPLRPPRTAQSRSPRHRRPDGRQAVWVFAMPARFCHRAGTGEASHTDYSASGSGGPSDSGRV